MTQDPFLELKQRQREMWVSFAPTAIFTTPAAGQLVAFAGVGSGESVLDVGTGTGVGGNHSLKGGCASQRA